MYVKNVLLLISILIAPTLSLNSAYECSSEKNAKLTSQKRAFELETKPTVVGSRVTTPFGNLSVTLSYPSNLTRGQSFILKARLFLNSTSPDLKFICLPLKVEIISKDGLITKEMVEFNSSQSEIIDTRESLLCFSGAQSNITHMFRLYIAKTEAAQAQLLFKVHTQPDMIITKLNFGNDKRVRRYLGEMKDGLEELLRSLYFETTANVFIKNNEEKVIAPLQRGNYVLSSLYYLNQPLYYSPQRADDAFIEYGREYITSQHSINSRWEIEETKYVTENNTRLYTIRETISGKYLAPTSRFFDANEHKQRHFVGVFSESSTDACSYLWVIKASGRNDGSLFIRSYASDEYLYTPQIDGRSYVFTWRELSVVNNDWTGEENKKRAWSVLAFDQARAIYKELDRRINSLTPHTYHPLVFS